MPRTVLGWLFVVGGALTLGTAAWLFHHYHHAYGLRLHTPSDSWLKDLPWDYDEQFGAMSDLVQDSAFFGPSGPEVVAMTRTLPPFASTKREFFERGFAEGLEQRSSTRPTRCASYTVDDVTWNCLELTLVAEGVSIRQRTYLAGRGITKAIVLFAGSKADFRRFGNPERWLRDLEWRGPSIFYAF